MIISTDMGGCISKSCKWLFGIKPSPTAASPTVPPSNPKPGQLDKDEDILEGTDIHDLDKILDIISNLLQQKRTQTQPKPTPSIWSIPEVSSIKTAKDTIDTAAEGGGGVSTEDGKEFAKVLKGVFTLVGQSHWIALGLVIIAAVLEKLETASANKKECLDLLDDLHRLGLCLRQIKGRPHLNTKEMMDTVKRTLSLIAESSEKCFALMNAKWAKRMFQSGANKELLQNLKTRIEREYRYLMFYLGIATFDAAATGSVDNQHWEVIRLLEVESPKRAVAVIIYGGIGMGKTTLADTVFSNLKLQDWKLSKVCLFDHRNSIPDIVGLQKVIIKDLTGEFKEIESYNEGQLLLQTILANQEAFIFIDNVLDPNALLTLLPRNLDKSKKLRLLLTAETESIANVLAVKERRTKLMKPMSIDDAMEIIRNELQGLHEEQTKKLKEAMKEMVLAPVSVQVVVKVIKESQDMLPAYEEAVESIKKITNQNERLHLDITEDSGVNKPDGTDGFPQDAEMPEITVEKPAQILSVRAVELWAYESLSEKAKEAFLDVCAFFRGWEWWKVECILGEKELQALQRRGFVNKEVQEEEEYRTGIIRKICKISVPNSFLDMGLDITQTTRFVDISKLERALLLHNKESQGRQEADIKGIFLHQSSSISRGYVAARDLDSMHKTLRVLSIRSGLADIQGQCKKCFDNLFYLEADDIPLPISFKQKGMRYLSYWPHENVDLSEMPTTLQILHLRGLSRASSLSFGKNVDLGEFRNLRSLVLSGSEDIKEIPTSISKLQALKILNLNGSSSLKHLPEEVGHLKALEELYLNGCESLEDLPESLEKLKSLKVLSLNWCFQLSNLPVLIGNLSELVKLNLKKCVKLRFLPESIGDMQQLQLLNLKGCVNLEELPEEICKLRSLRFLYFWDGMLLKNLPEAFSQLESLTELELNGCENLEKLPDSFRQLKSLKRLELWGCKNLSRLSFNFDKLSSLEYLDLSECKRLESIWLDIVLRMPTLKRLYIAGCPALCKQWQSLQKYEKPEQIQIFVDHDFRKTKYRGRKDHDRTCLPDENGPGWLKKPFLSLKSPLQNLRTFLSSDEKQASGSDSE